MISVLWTSFHKCGKSNEEESLLAVGKPLYLASAEQHLECYDLTYGLAKVTTVEMSLPSTLAIFESVAVCRQGKKWPDFPKI